MLPAHETAYAMTIHKSQGSEFDEVTVILPDRHYPVMTRELLYTAMTRARKKVEVWSEAQMLRSTVTSVIGRHGGLRGKLVSHEG
jgi:exodeoxyribonuclease V alpha subunit